MAVKLITQGFEKVKLYIRNIGKVLSPPPYIDKDVMDGIFQNLVVGRKPPTVYAQWLKVVLVNLFKSRSVPASKPVPHFVRSHQPAKSSRTIYLT